MALSNIIKHIHDKAEQEVAVIERQTKDQLEQVQSEIKDKLKAEKQRLRDIAERQIAAEYAQAVLVAKEKAKEERLQVQQQIIDKVYEGAMRKLSALDEADHKKMLEQLVEPLKKEKGEFVTNKDHQSLLKQVVKKVGCAGSVSDETIETAGGFIFRAESVDQDNTFETLLEQVRHETLIDVHQELFGNVNETV